MGDLEHAWYVRFGRLRAPPYLVTICLVSPWYTFPSCLGSLRAWMSCSPMYVK
jgi:hypothetical protein